MKISTGRKSVSLILKCVVILSAVIGTYLSATVSAGGFMSGNKVFMYFTIQSNIAVALISAVGAILLLRSKPVGNAWFVIKYVGAVSITLTGAVFTFVLAPTLGDRAWSVHNVLTHVVVPVAAIIDFFLTGIFGEVKRINVLFVTLPPLAYAIYAGIGFAAGWEFSGGVNYPYFFLNWGSPAGAFGFISDLPFMGCVWWIIALLILLIAVGLMYLLILGKLKHGYIKKRS